MLCLGSVSSLRAPAGATLGGQARLEEALLPWSPTGGRRGQPWFNCVAVQRCQLCPASIPGSREVWGVCGGGLSGSFCPLPALSKRTAASPVPSPSTATPGPTTLPAMKCSLNHTTNQVSSFPSQPSTPSSIPWGGRKGRIRSAYSWVSPPNTHSHPHTSPPR